MRDDIHKSAPVSRAWRAFMKHCARESDRKERAAESALRAIESDCKKELSIEFIERMKSCLQNPQAALFKESIADRCERHVSEKSPQIMEQEVLAHLRRREMCGEAAKSAVTGAIADAISCRKNAQLRAIEGHWRNEAGKSSLPAIEAAKKVLSNIGNAELAADILEGKRKAAPKKRGVELDEDLRG